MNAFAPLANHHLPKWNRDISENTDPKTLTLCKKGIFESKFRA